MVSGDVKRFKMNGRRADVGSGSRVRVRMSVLFVIILSVFLVGSVCALGITPGRTTYQYEPGVERNFAFSVLNTEGEIIDITVLSDGDLCEGVSISDSLFVMSADTKERRVIGSIAMPATLEPGSNKCNIQAVQAAQSAGTGTFLGGVVAVTTEIVVLVPYPGKYIEASADVRVNEDGELVFVLPVINRGDEEIEEVWASLEISAFDGREVGVITTNKRGVASEARSEIMTTFTEEIAFGDYMLNAVIYYDDESRSMSTSFRHGSPILALREIVVDEFKLGSISKFEMVVESMWNGVLNNSYYEMKIYNGEELVSQFRSVPEDMGALGEGVLVGYWESEGVDEDLYDVVLALNHKESGSEQTFQMDVSSDSIKFIGVNYAVGKEDRESIWILVILVVIGILITLIILWFVMVRVRKRRFRKR